ncbi:hypothetical protein ACWGQL_30230 [Streptomyces lydicus]|uniref:hypothetical protein n=1 Tax=Streptomyces lydicus TaxID=47763 RepID=UPI0037D973F7
MADTIEAGMQYVELRNPFPVAVPGKAEVLDTGWDARAAGSPPNCTWPSSRAKSPCRSW